MRTPKLIVAACLAVMITQPLAAEDTVPFECLVTRGDAELPADYLDDFLKESMGEPYDPAVNDRLMEVAMKCLQSASVSSEDEQDFIVGMISHILSTEAGNRIEQTSFPIAILDEAIEASFADKSIGPGDYMDRNSERYDAAALDLAAELDMSANYVQSLLMVYVTGKYELLLIARKLNAD